VTHDIDEAIFLGDRVYVMTTRPGRIKKVLDVPLARPRTLEVLTSEPFTALKREVLDLIREETLKAIAEGRPADGRPAPR
jgi:ABC-type nitrate/sulfonate/bicarbonate transport system ATPase subunit